jgi:predicted metal-binding protein
MSRQRVTVFVCVSCRAPADGGDSDTGKPGDALVPAIEAHLRNAGATDIGVQPAECLAVCKRPCTVAFAGESKWTYIVGDIGAEAHAAEIAAAAQSFAASENGIIPWKERPLSFRKGVVARVPPQTYRFTGNAE